MRHAWLWWALCVSGDGVHASASEGHRHHARVGRSSASDKRRVPSPRAPSPIAANVTVRRYELADPSNGTFATELDNRWVNETMAMVPQQTALVSEPGPPQLQPQPQPQTQPQPQQSSTSTSTGTHSPLRATPRPRCSLTCGTTAQTLSCRKTNNCEFCLCSLQHAVPACSSSTHPLRYRFSRMSASLAIFFSAHQRHTRVFDEVA